MASFNFNISESNFSANLISKTDTDCSSIFEYEVFSDNGDSVSLSLSGNKFLNSKYTLNGVESTMSLSQTIVYNNSLKISFSIQNSGVPGVFDSTELIISSAHYPTQSIVQEAIRNSDSAKCESIQPTFNDLLDTPEVKIGHAGKFLKVSDDELTIEYLGLNFSDIAYTNVNNNFSVAQTFGDNVTIAGNLTVNGATVQVDSQIVTANTVIRMNDGEVGNGVTNGFSGLEIDRGLESNFWFGFDEVRDKFTIGKITSLDAVQIATTQLVATRSNSLTDQGIVKWDNTLQQFVDGGKLITDLDNIAYINASNTFSQDQVFNTRVDVLGEIKVHSNATIGGKLNLEKLPINRESISVLVKDEILSNNLILNGDFVSSTDWLVESGWSISSGEATALSTTGTINQNIGSVSVGDKFEITYTTSNVLGGTVRCSIGDSHTTEVSGNGTFTERITASTNNSNFFVDGIFSFTGKITNVSVRKIIDEGSNQVHKKYLGSISGVNTGDQDLSGYSTISYVESLQGEFEIKQDSTTSITLSPADKGKVISVDNSSAITFTIDTGSLTNIGDIAYVDQMSVGEVEFVAGVGVTLQVNASRELKTDGQFSRVAIHKTGAATYRVFGELK